MFMWMPAKPALMRNSDSDSGDIYFDARASLDSPSSDECSSREQRLWTSDFQFEIWRKELTSIRERRRSFLQRMGLGEFVSHEWHHSPRCRDVSDDRSSSSRELQREIENVRSIPDALCSSSDELMIDSDYCIKDLDSGKRFIVRDAKLEEVGSSKMLTLQEFEAFLGLSNSVKGFLRKELPSAGGNSGCDVAKKQDLKGLWSSFSRMKSKARMHVIGSSPSSMNWFSGVKMKQSQKNDMEFSDLYSNQKIRAHNGMIRVMKFSPSGLYLASGGADCVIRIWKVTEKEHYPLIFSNELSCGYFVTAEVTKSALQSGKSFISVTPSKDFQLLETLLQEFHGHKGEILDVSWSNSHHLLSSSSDKTVCMWKVGCDGCLAVFQHMNYVTSVQFNPVDEGSFITGSIDGKVRVWQVSENRVTNWTDTRHIITSLCYRPDGKGCVVGSIAGCCSFYNFDGETLQLDRQVYVSGKKKSAGNRITSLQYSSMDSHLLMITSVDSKVRIFDGTGVIQKFRGLGKNKGLLAPSFTKDGRYIISAGKDSHVYIWDIHGVDNALQKRSRTIRPGRYFSSKGVTVAVSWPGIDRGDRTLKGSGLEPSSPLLHKVLEPTTFLKDPNCFSLGAWLLYDGFTRSSGTWPEEKLTSLRLAPLSLNRFRRHRHDKPTAWNQIIVTGNLEGFICAYHNCRLPFKL